MKHIAIIGNGIAGITAARHLRKLSRQKITVISSETDHFFSRTALMYIYMGHMKYEHTKPYEDGFWKKNDIHLMREQVISLDTQTNELKFQSGGSLSYDTLIIASGSTPNKLGWQGENLPGVQGLYSYQDLQQMEADTKDIKHAVIVGGGLIGVEMAEMLLSRKIEVTFLVREEKFWSNVLPTQEASLITNHIRSHQVDVRTETELTEIVAGADGRVAGVVTNRNEKIACQFVGLTVGVSPNITFLQNSGIKTKRGVLVNEYLNTNIPNVYAIGDCVERTYPLPGRKPVEQVWYTGRMMGEVVAQTICGKVTSYAPGPWFNSAKFFDIEYQTYGLVNSSLGEDEEEFYWEHPSQEKAMHFVWNRLTRKFLGVNTFGIRLRHNCFDRWLREQESIEFVIAHLAEANFDPEFFARYEKEIKHQFDEQNKKQISHEAN